MYSDKVKVKYTVFLIKKEYKEFDSIIPKEKVMATSELSDNINGRIYIGHNEENEPAWYSELKKILDNPPDLSNKSTRAVMLIKRKNRILAFTYGHGKSMIDSNSYERNFGLKIVLNNCAISKLKSIDSVTIDSVTRQSRTQTSKSSEIDEFQIDDIRDLLRAVEAEAKDFSRYGKVIAGKDSFHFHYPFAPHQLKELCDRLINDFVSTKYKKHFAWVDHLSEVEDPSLKRKLDNKLISNFNNLYNESDIGSFSIHMAPPTIVNMEDSILYSYLEAGHKFNELSLSDYFKVKKPNKEKDYNFDKLKRDKIFVHSETTNKIIDRWSVYDSINAEINYDGSPYILSMGIWYRIDNEFLTYIDNTIKNVKTSTLAFHPYDSNIHKSENDYNESVAKANKNIISMDKQNITIDNGRFEFCDLMSSQKHFIHVKPWKSSSTLSHLFSQGRISAQTLINIPEVIPDINKKIKKQGGGNNYFLNENENFGYKYTVVYAIIYDGNKEIHERLPFFSKLNFVDSIKTLENMQFNVEKMHIKKVE